MTPKGRTRLTQCLAGLALAFLSAACTTRPASSPSLIANLPGAVTAPYRISPAGNYVIDVSVNGQAALPFVIDTAAAASSIYQTHAATLGLPESQQSVLVQGFLALDERPSVSNVDLQISGRTFNLDQVPLLDTPPGSHDGAGLLGADILGDHALLLNKNTMMATLVPSEHLPRNAFSGWRKIKLSQSFGTYEDKGLHFAEIPHDDEDIPVLIDTGSNLNVINWHLAALDDRMRKVRSRVRNAQIHGVIDTAPLRIQTVFHDLELGNQSWPIIDVVVMDFDFDSTAPIDQPMMVAGVKLFTPWTVAFDLGGDAIYIQKAVDGDDES